MNKTDDIFNSTVDTNTIGGDSVISKELRCCVENLLNDQDLNKINSIDELKTLLDPCQNYFLQSNNNMSGDNLSYVMSVLNFYLHENRAEEENICRALFCDTSVNIGHIFYVVVLILTLMVSVFGNTLVTAIILKSRSLRKRPTNYFLLSLAISDLLCSIFLLPVKISKALDSGNFCLSLTLCQVYYTADYTVFTSSITHLLVICIDRFTAIVKPYRYPTIFSFKHIKYLISLIWTYACFWSVMTNINWNLLDFQNSFSVSVYRCKRVDDKLVSVLYLIVFWIPCAIMGFLYTRIWHIAVSQANEIHKRHNIHRSPNSGNYGIAMSVIRQKLLASRVLELRATKVICIVFGTFVVCWAPLITMVVTDTFISRIRIDPIAFKVLCEYFPHLNSTLNPFIYCLLHKDFQKNLKHIIQRMSYTSAHKTSLKRRYELSSYRDNSRMITRSFESVTNV